MTVEHQYCRYCGNAVLTDSDCFWCEERHILQDEKYAKRVNRCKDFVFCSNDLFGMDEHGNFRQYKPRGKYNPRAKKLDQIDMFGGNER